jgi:ABC-type uncharacterized transport system permease subunit
MIINIVGLAIIANLFTHWFTPIQSIKNKIIGKINFQPITTVLTCPKCFGLYLGIFHGCVAFTDVNPFIFGAVVSFVSYGIKFIIDKIEHHYEY